MLNMLWATVPGWGELRQEGAPMLRVSRPIVLALAFSLALTAWGTTATPGWADCTTDLGCLGFAQLRTDLQIYAPPHTLHGLLVKADAAQQLYPVDPCRSFRHAHALSNQVRGLGQEGLITPVGVQTIQSDITNLYPNDPC